MSCTCVPNLVLLPQNARFTQIWSLSGWAITHIQVSGDPRMKTASWAVSFVSVLSPRAREKATRVEMRVFSESCTLFDISIRRRTVRDEKLMLSKTERCSGQTESTTATWHSLMKSPSENGVIRRARMRETS